uniref:Cyclin-Q n=1 Tax=Plectus sambesii TaxID=2011161 RepID=A0A914W0W4_9BILA
MLKHRKVFEYIMEAGVKLEAKSSTVAAAVVICYKFLNRMPPEESSVCPYTIGAACLYLAGKVEEDMLKIRDVTNVCYRVINPNKPPIEVDEDYWNLREGVGRLEYLVLRTMGFQLQLVHPHKFLLHYLVTLKHWLSPSAWERSPLAETAWTLLRDAYARPDWVTAHSPQTVAIICLNLALRIHSVDFPLAPEWYRILHSEMTSKKLITLSKELLCKLYEEQSADPRG